MEDDIERKIEFMNELQQLLLGMPVSDIAGRPVGVVGRIESTAFEVVSGPRAPIWVHPDALFGVDYGVTLICNERRLREYQAK
jgi:hypothetical protein